MNSQAAQWKVQVRVNKQWVVVAVVAVSAYAAAKQVQARYPNAKAKWPTRSAW